MKSTLLAAACALSINAAHAAELPTTTLTIGTSKVVAEVATTPDQRSLGLMNRMRLFAPQEVLVCADAVLKTILDTYLKPRVELRQLVIEALAEGSRGDPLLPFSLVCRHDLDQVRNSMA